MATVKQKKAIDILSENVGMPVGEAMRKAGYTEVTSLTPARLTKSKAFKTLAEQIPDALVTEKHKEMFKKTRKDYLSFPAYMEDDEIIGMCEEAGLTILTVQRSDKSKLAFFVEMDAQAVGKAVEMAHKMKGAYLADKPQAPTTANYNLFLNPQVQVMVHNFEEGLKALIANKVEHVDSETPEKPLGAE